jgi:hypothetical protein
MTFKIINTLKINNDNFKSKDDFKNQITIKKKKKNLAFPFFITYFKVLVCFLEHIFWALHAPFHMALPYICFTLIF